MYIYFLNLNKLEFYDLIFIYLKYFRLNEITVIINL